MVAGKPLDHAYKTGGSACGWVGGGMGGPRAAVQHITCAAVCSPGCLPVHLLPRTPVACPLAHCDEEKKNSSARLTTPTKLHPCSPR